MKTKRRRQESGVSLFVATTSMLFIVPMMGLVADTGFLYGAKSQLQAAADGSALAAARALRLGATTDAQRDNAKQNAVNWFYANFPTGTWGTTNTLMNTTDTYVSVYDDASNPNLRHVDVNASTTVPTYFMRYFGTSSLTLNAKGYATRRDVVAMLVLDRSGSMGSACGNLRTAAKLFVGQFAAQRDRIGMVSFSNGTKIDQSPTTDFRTQLGYTFGSSSATGKIDDIECNGGTGSAAAISLAYNELYKIKLPGALNLLLIETDGLPTEATYNFWDGAAWAIKPTSNCLDNAGLKKLNGGWAATTPLPAFPSQPINARKWMINTSNPTGVIDMDGPDAQHPGYMSDITGTVGSLYSDPDATNYHLLEHPIENTSDQSSNKVQITTAAPGCTFTSGSSGNFTDLLWIPKTDAFGNAIMPSTNPYKTVATEAATGRYLFTSGTTMNSTDGQELSDASLNVTDNAAYRARTSKKFCDYTGCTATASELKAYVYTIGFTTSVDHDLLQRMANDANGDIYNATPAYTSCATNAGCVHYDDQNQGTYIYAPTTTQLTQAFLSIASQVLRLSN